MIMYVSLCMDGTVGTKCGRMPQAVGILALRHGARKSESGFEIEASIFWGGSHNCYFGAQDGS